ncbi:MULTISPECIES: tocopherol cyclase family protein [unclassified Fusibacter]|uniref:tocopherol cyclase family protein n=1 Tax=unclassified Fusibacter TaxID=2624464 RepID=UPI0010135609|nr:MULTISPECIES: tocopherol cyclase family protein [unclassified Fusibacter]MCK8059353.1 tocopherol cyclase family protein [Fusibacter sp. A2]NPE21183.1 hypothetical protein [Fusibacter sp. A1]RXV62451.1 hypothetical protein DWB64_05055 [Fusibacter sp. A1]
MKLYKPHVFQGNFKKTTYFEGWYYKLVDPSIGLSLCLIAGVAIDGDPHGFIQYADSITGTSGYARYTLEELDFSQQSLVLQIGKHTLTDRHIDLHADDKIPYDIDVSISNHVSYPVSITHPGIMGPFRFAPFMECYHGVHLITSSVEGTVTIEGETHKLENAKLYLEKDWGKSFPREWIWLEAGAFEEENVHLMFSVANIPWIGKAFNGHLGYVWLGETRIGLGTYRNSHYSLEEDDDKIILAVAKGKYHIVITAQQRTPIDLVAPSLGNMTRKMKEDLNGLVSLEVYKDSELVYKGTSEYAGIERCGDIDRLKG